MTTPDSDAHAVDGIWDCFKRKKDEKLLEDSTDGINISVSSPNKKYATHYKMDHKKNGKALIFSYSTFKKTLKLDDRKGNDNDVRNLIKTLQILDIEYEECLNLTAKEITDNIRYAATKKDYSDYNCLLVFVLSHGYDNKFAAKDKICKISMLWEAFTPDKCKTLADKPKLFFFQTCSGDKADSGISVNFQSSVESDGENDGEMALYSDILIGKASFSGHCSFRRCTGSCYIQGLCEVLNDKAYDFHILDLLVFVNQQVALDFESASKEPSFHKKKQTPVVTHTFKRFMQFQRKQQQE